MITFTFGDPALIVQGIVEQYLYNRETGDIVAYDKLGNEGDVNYTFEANELTGGFLSPLVGVIHHSARLRGAYTSQGFSLAQKALQTGGTLSFGGRAPVCETVTASGASLTVSGNPLKSLAQYESDEYGWCQVREHGATRYSGQNYGIDLATKTVQGFTAEVGKTYDVFYTADYTSAQVLSLPGAPDPACVAVVRKYGVYRTQGGKAAQSTLAGYMYVIVPNAILGGDAGVTGNQTTAANTSYTWTAVAPGSNLPSCENCGESGDPLGYYVFAPCGDPKQSVEALAVVGGSVTVAGGTSESKKQIPVKYIMNDNTIVQPVYSDLTYSSNTPSVATVDENGVVTAVSQGHATITITLTRVGMDSLTTVCTVTSI